MNKQCKLVLEAYVKHRGTIDELIIVAANRELQQLAPDHEFRDNSITRDGLFDPWFAVSPEYEEYVSEYGNDGDEDIISVITRAVLYKEHPRKYIVILSELFRIEQEGL